MRTPQHPDDREREALEAPPELVSALQRLPKAPVFIPPTVDETILRAAHRQLSRSRAPWFRGFPAVRWAVGMAVMVVLLAIAPRFLPRADLGPVPTVVQEDLNQDGRVDILDAFALARELQTGAHPRPHLDVNRDGVVDERDVAMLSARAVSVERGDRS
jgi:hypothetical protein